VTGKEWTVDGVTGPIEGLSHEFHIEGCTSEAMNQKGPDLPAIEEDMPFAVFEFLSRTHASAFTV
jgi:hypothetical protein